VVSGAPTALTGEVVFARWAWLPDRCAWLPDAVGPPAAVEPDEPAAAPDPPVTLFTVLLTVPVTFDVWFVTDWAVWQTVLVTPDTRLVGLGHGVGLVAGF
jgi:hypothetical protein